MQFTLFVSDVKQNKSNCSYPHKHLITSKEELLESIKFDNVSAEFKRGYRSNANFISVDNIVMDCDNDHSDYPSDWVDEKVLETLFKDVNYAVVFSRNHMKKKNGVSARPRFHIYFPVDIITNPKIFEGIKRAISEKYAFFDKGALDVARFIFGTEQENIIWHEGNKNITEAIEYDAFQEYVDNIEEKKTYHKEVINEGNRNSHMSHFASIVLKRYGNTEEAGKAYLEEAKKCNPPLSDSELRTIYKSALNFYKNVISISPTYVVPEEYVYGLNLTPNDYSDIGEAELFAKHYGNKVRYNPATKYLVYNGVYWEESDVLAHGKVQDFTARQLKEAEIYKDKVMESIDNMALTEFVGKTEKQLEGMTFNEDDEHILNELDIVESHLKFVRSYRSSKKVSAIMTEAQPLLYLDYRELDNKEYLLNTPNATYDLRKGMLGAQKHNPLDYITKCTSVSPSDKGMDLWLDCLNKIYQDEEAIEYVQRICGLASIGKVYIEALIIAYGDGGNGKSTFWNTIARVLGTYYGKLSAEALTTNCKRNVRPEMAEIKGKRLIIASESQEGARLDDSIVKQLCSTDDVAGEKKFKDPFSFTPCHTLVLYTNHLPKVSGRDDGLWRRLIVIPFNYKLTGDGDIKNYSDYLYTNAGEAVLKWIIEGAKKVIDENFNLNEPECVKNSINEYKQDNDWFKHFLDDCCEVDKELVESSNNLYQAYRRYCQETGEYVRSTTDFYSALKRNGFNVITEKRKKLVKGLKLSKELNAFDEFLH